MSTNLSRSQCDCGHQFTLGSFRGQKIEFRKYAICTQVWMQIVDLVIINGFPKH